MRKILLCSAAAAALLFAVPIASAQAPGDQDKEHKAAPERTTPQHVAPKAGTEERESPQHRTQNETRPEERPGKGTPGKETPGKETPGRSTETRPSDPNKGTTAEERREEKATPTNRADRNEERKDRTSTETRPGDRADSANEHKDRASETAQQIPAAKQDKIREAVRKENVENISHVDFALNVGVIVPQRYQFHPLPSELIAEVPEYRGYDYLVINDEIVIVQPESHKIVYAMAESQSAANDRPCH
jgi:hypothetical protein